MYDIFDIVEGNFNRALNRKEEIATKRIQICYSCPLYSQKLGGKCNNKLWYNPNTGDVSTEQKDGYKKGCGCILKSKVRATNAKCPIGKW